MKLKKSIVVSLAAACALFCGGAALAQPTVTNFTPNGVYQFQSSNTFSFTLTSATGVTNISVLLTAQSPAGGGAILGYLTSSAGLTISGSPTSETVTGPLMSNELYSVVVTAQDAGGTTSSTATFDTINPSYTWEAEDYDYTNGQFIDNPQVNQYSGLSATSGTDYQHNVSNGGSTTYRPQGLTMETTSDKLRTQHNGLQDYDVGYNNGGDYANYTRHYPAGTYNVYLRGAGGNGAQNDCASLTVNSGTATINGSGPYQFSIPASSGGWQGWTWDPMIDQSTGKPAQITLDGSVNTLRVTIDGGNCNENFYMLLPVNNASTTVVITNLYPDGAHQFERTNALVFTANSTVGINTNSILVQLTGTSLQGSNSTAICTPGNGLILSGNANSVNVSLPVLSIDTAYTVSLQVVDVNGGISTTSYSFDTVSPTNYTFEAEDFNYQGGQFFDNPQTNAYFNPDPSDASGVFDGIVGVDYFYPSGQAQNASGYKYDRYGLSVEVCSDITRVQYGGTNSYGGVIFTNTDYDVGYTAGGIWANYTRHFPAGQYNIYMRAANGNGTPASPDSCTLSFVTSAPTQGSQTTSKIGTFTVPATGGWQSFKWVPLENSAGTILPVTLTGNEQTLQMLMDGASYNANYFMLVPVVGFVKVPPSIDTFYPDGRNLLQGTNALTFTVDSTVGIPDSGVSVVLNGGNVTNLTFSGTPNALIVNCPLKQNVANNVAVITMTDNYGSTTFTDRFDSFSPTNLTFEAEDFDYNGGQFFDYINGASQIDAYNNLGATAGIDINNDNTLNGSSTSYRPNLGVENTGDLQREVYIADNNAVDSDFGYSNGGYWANYTRTYPAGVYNVYLRASNPNTQPVQTDAANLSVVTSGAGTANQTTSELGTFNVLYTGAWQTYNWAPLVDTHGNLARVTFTGTTNTLRVTVDGGNYNANFYVLAPADLNIPVISNVSPSGATIFQSSNALTFAVSSPAGIATNAITVTVNGVTVASSNLVFTGSSTSWNVSDPSLPANTLCTAIITVTSLTGEILSATNSFDTIDSTNYQWEAEDYDYNGGQYFDNPQVNAYNNLGSIAGIDNVQLNLDGGRPFAYRTNTVANPAPGTTPAGDAARSQFTPGTTDYQIGYFGESGEWLNYTRHYPAGTYNVIARFASGNGSPALPQLSQVTSGWGTTNQTTNELGTFTVPSNGWEAWEWCPLLDNNGNLVKVTLDGSATTLQLEGESQGFNANFFILVPTTANVVPAPLVLKVATSAGNANLSFYAQTGYTYQIQYKTNLTDATWIDLGSPIIGNNTTNTIPDPLGTSHRFYRIHP